MCVETSAKALREMHQKTKTFVAYKLVWLDFDGRVLRSYYQKQPWGPGVHKAHKQAKRYRPNKPHGIHFYFSREDINHIYEDSSGFILPVHIDPQDVIATECDDGRIREAAALKVTVTKHAWNKIMKKAADRECCLLPYTDDKKGK